MLRRFDFRASLLAVLFVIALALTLFGVGCAQLGSPPTATVNDQVAIAIQAITTARKTSTQLLVAGKITVAQDQATQAKLDAARAALVAAQAVATPAPAASGAM